MNETPRCFWGSVSVRKKIMLFVGVAVAVYFLFFAVIWAGGGYVLTQSGKLRSYMGVDTGIAIPDVAEWQPLVGHWQSEYTWPNGEVRTRCDLIGRLFSPLIVLVQTRNPPFTIIDQDSQVALEEPISDGMRYHPIRGEDLEMVMNVIFDSIGNE